MSKRNAKTATILTLVLLMASVMLFANVQVKAQLAAEQPVSGAIPAGRTPYTIPNQAYVSFRPRTIGLLQELLVNGWCSPSPSTDRAFQDFKFTITKPDGTTEDFTMDSEPDTGAAWFTYIPDQVGTYKIKMDSPGTYFPVGMYYYGVITTNGSGTIFTGDSWYPPSSTPTYELVVQQDFVASWPPAAIPTDYWERPVRVQNREWLKITGDFPWFGPALSISDLADFPADTSHYWNNKQDFTPYVQAPNSAHIAWKRLGSLSGITGAGRYAESGAGGYYEYPVPFRSGTTSPTALPCIIAGRGYQTNTKMIDGTPTQVLECYDIRTGELYWDAVYPDFNIPSATSSFGQWIWAGGIEYSGGNPTLVYITGGQLLKINPFTGALSNYSLTVGEIGSTVTTPVTSGTYYMNGYVLSIQNLGGGNYRLINWTTLGSSTNFASRIQSNISWPMSSLGAGQDFELGVAIQSGTGWPNQPTGTLPGVNMFAVSFKTGDILWNKTFENLVTYATVSSLADHGKFAFLTDHGTFQAYDLLSGNLVWESERMDVPWDAAGFGAYDTTSAYGMFFRAAYSGIYAFSWDDGKILWKYEAPTNPFETPYTGRENETVNSFNGVAIAADGKLYSINTEHTPTQPITRGWQLHCINITTGEGIWKIMVQGSVDAVADGYLSVSNSYDGYQYVFGKGKSATTVTAPDTVIPLGSGAVIKGAVMDMSPASPNTPCVSKDSMTTQMQYLHCQAPIDGIYHNETITGVPVSLTALGSDGTFIDIGTTTTDGYGGTFGMAWTPPKQDTYTITAAFAGDDSYGSSLATTTVSVGPAPAEINIPEAPTPVDNTMLLYGILAAVIVAIILALVALFWKR
jgi:hypothetical protein